MARQWAWHMLIAADNDLLKIVRPQLEQLARAPKRVDLAIQVDSPGKRARRHVLRKDGRLQQLPARKGTDRNLNAGSKQSLINFLIATRRMRKSPSIAVIFSGHGTGIADLKPLDGGRSKPKDQPFVRKGAFALGVDNTSKDYLDNNELQEAIEYAYLRYDHPTPKIIGCDACLMATVEVAHQLRNCGHFLVASQHTTPFLGWPYERILKNLTARIEPIQAVKTMVKAYADAEFRLNKEDMTLSAVKLDRMDDLAVALDRLGGTLLHCLQGNLRRVAEARQNARAFANFDSIDLHGFVDSVDAKFKSGAGMNGHGRVISAAAKAVVEVLKDAIVATNNDPKKSKAHGLSVYLPNSRVIDAYHDLPLSKAAPQWHDFAVAYGAMRHLI